MTSDEPHARWSAPSVIAALLLAGYLALALYAAFSPSNDPQKGMATGFACFSAVVLASLGALLVWGVRRGRRGIVWFVLAVTLLPAASLVARLVHLLVRAVSGSPR